MSDQSPSTRFRGVAIAAVSGTVLALGITWGALALPYPDGPGTSGSRLTGTAIDPESLGASGLLPWDESVDPDTIAALDHPRRGMVAESPTAGPLAIPPIVLDSYRRAEAVLAARIPACGLRWSLLAGLGQVISEHAKGGNPDQSGVTGNPILGPRLDGSPGLAEIPDTDDGWLDGDVEWDRAAGPMQIIPQVWQRLAADGDVSGTADPHNVYDASLVAGRYLCENGSDLRSVQGQAEAFFRYKRSEAFVQAAVMWSRAYESRAEPDPTVVPTEAELLVLPTPETITLPKQLPPAGPLPRGPVQAPVSPLPQPTRPASGDGSVLGRSRSGPAQPPLPTGTPTTTTNPIPTSTNNPTTTNTKNPTHNKHEKPDHNKHSNPTPTTTNNPTHNKHQQLSSTFVGIADGRERQTVIDGGKSMRRMTRGVIATHRSCRRLLGVCRTVTAPVWCERWSFWSSVCSAVALVEGKSSSHPERDPLQRRHLWKLSRNRVIPSTAWTNPVE